jgi:hypothetical protein
MASISTLILGLGLLFSTGQATAPHPDHGAGFHEQIIGSWDMERGGLFGRQLTVYEDGRFAFLQGGKWWAGSYYILRTDEQSTGVLRIEYYKGGNLNLQEVRFELISRGHDHAALLVEVQPAAGNRLKMTGQFSRRD